ncbi:hypothetical protein AB0B89_35070 [Sphaerisporangium sp. NPDC049002]|uniref:hypothetical protein n=1 Tax=unclassified Sphaerisporangium TaxID=2630420 RepID=UPI0033D48DC5
MSSDPVLSEAVARALGGYRTPPPERDPGTVPDEGPGPGSGPGSTPGPGSGPGSGSEPGEPQLLYARVIGLCRVVGEERFFSAAFSRVRDERAGVPARRRHPCGSQDAWVLELDVDEVLRDALGGDAPRPGGG